MKSPIRTKRMSKRTRDEWAAQIAAAYTHKQLAEMVATHLWNEGHRPVDCGTVRLPWEKGEVLTCSIPDAAANSLEIPF